MTGSSIPLLSITVSLVEEYMFLWCLFNVTDINEVYEQPFFNENSDPFVVYYKIISYDFVITFKQNFDLQEKSV